MENRKSTTMSDRCNLISKKFNLTINDIITFRGNYKRYRPNTKAWNIYTLISEMRTPTFGVTTEEMVFRQERNY